MSPQRHTMSITETSVSSILTRTSGYLAEIASHTLQPYRGCTFGSSLCGVGCYAQHNPFVTRGRKWGQFLEVRTNADEAYLRQQARELRWARKTPRGRFTIFCSSVTDPFVSQERTYRITRKLLSAMCSAPPDELILQTHSHHVLDEIESLAVLNDCCQLRVHVSIESDRDRLPGLPPPASSVSKRLAACGTLRSYGIQTVVTVAPLLPIDAPEQFFERIATVADAVVIDHFVEGDGTSNGGRTLKTALPEAMRSVLPRSTHLNYRAEIVEIARRVMPGRVGVGQTGFAGEWA